VTRDTGGAGRRIGGAAGAWLGGLDAGRRSKAVYPFDSAERFVWEYTPGPRRGLALADMTEAQRTAALAIADASLSQRGAREVRAIIALEPILGELERRAGRSNWTRRDAGLYWFAVFGEPGGAAPWSWRIGGHHVAIQVTVADGQVIASAPSFLGANPATVPDGPFAGRRALDGEEAFARALLASLSPEQRTVAVVDPVAPPDIFSGNGRHAELREVPHGIAFEALDPDGRDHLERLIRHYLDRAGVEIAEAEWDRVRAAGLGAVTFAWAGSDAPGQGHYYAIRGPRLLIEYDNTQNSANHIHAVWRDPTNDWGEDLLAAHYRASHRPG
jgi:plasmid stabilization system protein ParE